MWTMQDPSLSVLVRLCGLCALRGDEGAREARGARWGGVSVPKPPQGEQLTSIRGQRDAG